MVEGKRDRERVGGVGKGAVSPTKAGGAGGAKRVKGVLGFWLL